MGTARRAWESPTWTWWLGQSSQLASLVVVVTLVLRRLPAAEASLWSLFLTIGALQALATFGFLPTCTRAIALARGGAESVGNLLTPPAATGQRRENWTLLREVDGAMRPIFGGAALLWLVVMSVCGTLLLVTPVSGVDPSSRPWVAWSIVLAGTTVSVLGSRSLCVLQGFERMADVSRVDAGFALGGLVAQAGVLLAGRGLVELVLAQHLLGAARAWQLRGRRLSLMAAAPGAAPSPRAVGRTVRELWPAAWRSGVGVTAVFGLNQSTGLLVAQLAHGPSVIAYNLALRAFDVIGRFANAPFYSHLPEYARLWAAGEIRTLARVSTTNMKRTAALFLVAAVLGGLTGPWLVRHLASAHVFPTPAIWWGLSAALFCERVGAMHLQLYSVTNDIVWHRVTLGYAALFLVTAFPLSQLWGTAGLPVAMLIGYVGWYCPYGIRKSRAVLRAGAPPEQAGS